MKSFFIFFVIISLFSSTIYADFSLCKQCFPNYISQQPIILTSNIFLEDTDSVIFTAKRKSLTKKSPWIALGLAVVPGFFIHGLGHFYAGKPLVGSILLICGFVGVGLVVVGIIMIGVSGAVLTPGLILTSLTGVPIGISEAISGIQTALGLINIGGILFIGSWWIDIIGAPISCIMRNKRIQEEFNATILPMIIVKF